MKTKSNRLSIALVQPFSAEILSGITNKIISQYRFLKINNNTKLFIFDALDQVSDHDGDIVNQSFQVRRTRFIPQLLSFLIQDRMKNAYLYNQIVSTDQFDVVYIRYPYPSPFFLSLLARPRDSLIVTEHETVEPLEYRMQKKFLYVLADFLLGRAIRRRIDAFVGVTEEITDHQRNRSGANTPAISIGNGFDTESVPLRSAPVELESGIELLCVGNISPWHGLDRLISGLASYSKEYTIHLNIVGNGSEIVRLKELSRKTALEDVVLFHGFLSGEELSEVYDRCHIAVGSLGIHRIGLTAASTLKAREYTARGIPFIYGIDDLDFPSDFPYILRVPSTDEPIDIKELVSFASRTLRDRDHPERMRAFARENLDVRKKTEQLEMFLTQLKGVETAAGGDHDQ
jgi:glycosyltransferase involved in cell wall biosynthesis